MPRTVLEKTATGLLASFVALAVVVRRAGELPGDGAVLQRSSCAWSRALAEPVDAMTGYAGTAVLTALVVVLLVRFGRRRHGVLVAVSVTGALVGNALLKQLVARPRPDLLPAAVAVSPYSFPSGHAAATAALAVTVLLGARGSRALRPAAVAGVLLVLGAAAAQLVLGRHHLSDVVGGWLWAGAWTTAVWAGAQRRVGR